MKLPISNEIDQFLHLELVPQVKIWKFGYPGAPFWGPDSTFYDCITYHCFGFYFFSLCWYWDFDRNERDKQSG